mgnify:CR=1 FL=1|jgi:hypothetical protein
MISLQVDAQKKISFIMISIFQKLIKKITENQSQIVP